MAFTFPQVSLLSTTAREDLFLVSALCFYLFTFVGFILFLFFYANTATDDLWVQPRFSSLCDKFGSRAADLDL